MVDSVQIWPPGFRLADTYGVPLSGAQVRFFLAGTTTPKTMYSDKGLSVSLGSIIYTRADGIPVASEGSQTAVTVYSNNADYKVDVLDSDDVTVFAARDNVRGALDTSTFLTSSSVSSFSLPVVATSIGLTLSATHKAKLVNCNPSGGNFTLTFTAAATLADAWFTYILNSSATGQVLLSASENISIAGGTVTKYALESGECIGIACDGTAFKVFHHVLPRMQGRNPSIITITDRVTASPGSPTPGARYIVSTGFGSFATHDVIEYNGTDFNKYTPPTDCGWIAFVLDEDIYYFFINSAWVAATATSTYAGTVKISTQALMETGTATDTAVLIGHQHYHPGHPKVWLFATVSAGTPTLVTSYNVTGITDTGTGNLGVTIANDFTNASWCGLAGVDNADASLETGEGAGCFLATKAAGSVQVCSEDGDEDGASSDLADPAAWNFAAWGDLP